MEKKVKSWYQILTTISKRIELAWKQIEKSAEEQSTIFKYKSLKRDNREQKYSAFYRSSKLQMHDKQWNIVREHLKIL